MDAPRPPQPHFPSPYRRPQTAPCWAGHVTTDDGARIAANAVVLKEIPENATAVGVPARVVRIAGEKVDFAGQVDQIHVTDPVQKELQALNSRLEWLEQLMDEQARSKNL